MNNNSLPILPSLTYALRYIGSIPILVSIKMLSFEMRTRITRECIHRVCEDAEVKAKSFRVTSNDITSSIGSKTNLKWSTTNVHLTVNVNSITVEDFQTGAIFFHHRLSCVSFASAGENEMLDFVSYVAKDGDVKRTCYVFQCTSGVSRNFIASIGRAFSLGYQGFKKTQNETNDSSHLCPFSSATETNPHSSMNPFPQTNEPATTSPNNTRSDIQDSFDLRTDDSAWLLENECLPQESVCPKSSIDESMSSEVPPTTISDVFNRKTSANVHKPVYSNQNVGVIYPLEPIGEPWYLGRLSRAKAESLLQYDGDFLVRASTQQAGQFVLSGLQGGKRRHLLLVNHEGQVRTKDRVFTSIQDLIYYHLRSRIPIRSSDSELNLIIPVSFRSF